jgi:tetratricopeptide (TPR) repeat protein
MRENAAYSLQNIEKDAWESFEVGSYEDVIQISKANPANVLLAHLAYIAELEASPGKKGNLEDVDSILFAKTSVFSPLIKSYFFYYQGKYLEAFQAYAVYLKSNNPPLCFTLIRFGVKVSMEAEKFKECLFIISLDRDPLNARVYIREKVECLYQLKRHEELVEYFKTVYKFAENDNELMLKLGLTLNSIGRYKEAMAILSKIPDKLEMPSFDEKKKEFQSVIDKIPELEKKKELSSFELRDLGFAYLFNCEYKKAEEVFRKAVFAAQ